MTTSAFKILFKITSSIACFKVAELISSLIKDGHRIRVMASKNSLNFVGSSTWQGLTGFPVIVDQFSNSKGIEHIELDRWADLIVLCPATASRLNQMAAGISTDIIGDSFLAHDFKKPYLVFPAMNWAMYEHPATQNSIKKLKEFGLLIQETDTGVLACNETGKGRLLPVPEMKSIIESFVFRKTSTPSKILITAGGTSEPIDSVRSLTNTSTGETGRKLAEFLARHGNHIKLITSRNHGSIKDYKNFISSAELYDLVQKETLSQYDYIFMAAAISDYKVNIQENLLKAPIKSAKKIDSDQEIDIKLVPQDKLLSLIDEKISSKTSVVAFKLTSNALEAEKKGAIEKLFKNKSVKYVIHNDLKEINKSKDIHKFYLYDRNMELVNKFDSIELCGQYIISEQANPHPVEKEKELR